MTLANLKTRFVTLLRQRLGFSRKTSFRTIPRGWHMMFASTWVIASVYFVKLVVDVAQKLDMAAHADPGNWLAWVGFAVLLVFVIGLLWLAPLGSASFKVLVDNIVDMTMRKPRFRIARKEKTCCHRACAQGKMRV